MSAQAAIFGCEGLRLTAREAAFFREADPWGFIVFARNIDDPAQLSALTASLRDCVGRAAPVLVDQEGGRVARLRPPHWRAFPPAIADPTEEAVELRHRLIAHDLSRVGLDVSCAPLLDLPQPGAHKIIGDRALAADPAEIARRGHAVRRGLEAGGVLPVIKHLPGHGRATADSHEALPRIAAGRDELEADFAPFRAHADAPMGMTGHLVFEAIDPEAPSTLSPAVISAIREEIGFDGLLMTDDISMGALSGDVATLSARALAAGCDVVLHCNGRMDEMEAVAGAAGALSGAALARAAAVDALPRAARAEDIAALARRYEELTGEAADA